MLDSTLYLMFGLVLITPGSGCVAPPLHFANAIPLCLVMAFRGACVINLGPTFVQPSSLHVSLPWSRARDRPSACRRRLTLGSGMELPAPRPYCHAVCGSEAMCAGGRQAKRVLVECYTRLRTEDAAPGSATSYRITVRQLEALVRLSEALARLRCSDTITPANVREVWPPARCPTSVNWAGLINLCGRLPVRVLSSLLPIQTKQW